MQFRCGNAVTRCHISHQSLLAIECCYLHSRIMKELADKLSGSQRLTNRRLRRIACFCAAALCLSAAAAQDSEDVREKTYRESGDFAKAEPLYKRAIKIWEAKLGPKHPNTLSGMSNLALLYQDKGDSAKAEPLYVRVLKMREETLGPDNPQVANSLSNLATLYYHQGNFAKAEPMYERALKIYEKAFGAEHPHTANIQNNLGAIYLSQGDLVKAESLFKQALETREKIFGPNNPATGESINKLPVPNIQIPLLRSTTWECSTK